MLQNQECKATYLHLCISIYSSLDTTHYYRRHPYTSHIDDLIHCSARCARAASQYLSPDKPGRVGYVHQDHLPNSLYDSTASHVSGLRCFRYIHVEMVYVCPAQGHYPAQLCSPRTRDRSGQRACRCSARTLLLVRCIHMSLQALFSSSSFLFNPAPSHQDSFHRSTT